jgi:hypothetical protein
LLCEPALAPTLQSTVLCHRLVVALKFFLHAS